MPAHLVSGDWKEARKTALTARATAVSDTLDHLTDIEEMLEADGRDLHVPNGHTPIGQEIRTLASRLRSLRSEYESEAARLG